jgi:hypothetical protein
MAVGQYRREDRMDDAGVSGHIPGSGPIIAADAHVASSSTLSGDIRIGPGSVIDHGR